MRVRPTWRGALRCYDFPETTTENSMHAHPALHRPRRPALFAAAAALLAAGGLHAEPAAPLDRASLSLGAFYSDPRIDVQADTNYGRIDSGTYEPSHVTLPRVKASLLLGDTQGLDFDYYRYNKGYTPRLTGSTNLNGLPLTGNGALDAKLKIDLAQLAYKWWIGSGSDVLGIGAGAAYYHASIDGTASGILNGVAGNADYSESKSAFAPLLELGWRHAFSPTVRMYVDGSGIRKNGGNVSGHIYGGALGVEWYMSPNVGLSAEYAASRIKLERDSDNSDLNYRLQGPAVFVKMRW
jgi:hypothetical protein